MEHTFTKKQMHQCDDHVFEILIRQKAVDLMRHTIHVMSVSNCQLTAGFSFMFPAKCLLTANQMKEQLALRL